MAEQLGDETYHELLKDFFSDITNPILDNNGEIYQYVGDEVIVAWKYEDGIKDNQCVKCFFDIKVHINNLREKYLKRYGLVPAFKAGIHCGNGIDCGGCASSGSRAPSGAICSPTSWVENGFPITSAIAGRE